MKRVIGIASGGTVMALAFLLVAQFPSHSAARAGGNVNSGRTGMIMEKPYFSISLEADLCVGYFLFNGQLLHAAEMEHVKFDLPVNHWMRRGENELMMMLAPIDEEGNVGKFPRTMKCTMTLRVRPSGGNLAENITIVALTFAAKGAKGIENNTPAGRLDSEKGFVPSRNGPVIVGKATKKSPFKKSAQLSPEVLRCLRSDCLYGSFSPATTSRISPALI